VANEGVFPIVYVDRWPLRGGLSGQYYALMVVGVDADSVTSWIRRWGKAVSRMRIFR
jgi:hypothetical protein